MTTILILSGAWLLWAPVAATPQQAASVNFEVASVKPASAPSGVTVVGSAVTTRKGSGVSIPRNTGGPGTDDPGRIYYPFISLKALLARAWDSYFEIKSPDWLDTDLVAVEAIMPPDTAKAQFQEMLRNLITDRFQLKYHIEPKEITGYALVVTKNGPKMKESADQSDGAPEARPPRSTEKGPDGFPIMPPTNGPALVSLGIDGGRSRMIYRQQTVQTLVQQLGRMLNSTVADATGLTAKYDFTVTFAGGTEPGGAIASSLPGSVPEAGEPLPDIFGALQSQLGLKLEQKKVTVQVFVVDHMDQTPAGN